MVSTAPEDIQQTAIALQGEQRVVIHGVTWEGYLQILDALPQSRSTRLIYDEGTLEFTMPTEDHDFSGRMIGLFIRVLVREFGKKIKTMGSTTLNFPGLKKGAEPDEAFYIQNQPLV
ncbi:MAG: Uma2 family endonuclease, partial [Leptolyngbyaceae cyanobacterium CAN_BIN12]|nr:Uma2 family endonuclease [Leptolyngbyaceae cyanobacterium CAN_BIN12]